MHQSNLQRGGKRERKEDLAGRGSTKWNKFPVHPYTPQIIEVFLLFRKRVTFELFLSQVARVVSLQWYDGKIGPAAEEDAPALVICYDNGRVQMMASEADESEDKIV